MKINDIPITIRKEFQRGAVIPAMPLALTKERKFDSLHQQAVLRYYIDAGAGGIAVGVHSTQFRIRDPKINLFKPVLSYASDKIDEWCSKRNRSIIKIAGICGKGSQAMKEAELACELGYHAGLLSLSAMKGEITENLLEHCRKIAKQIPVIGFYLQTAVGGTVLPYSFWREFVEIDNILAIKVAAFNRYQTIDVIRAIADSGKDVTNRYTDPFVFGMLTPLTNKNNYLHFSHKFNLLR